MGLGQRRGHPGPLSSWNRPNSMVEWFAGRNLPVPNHTSEQSSGLNNDIQHQAAAPMEQTPQLRLELHGNKINQTDTLTVRIHRADSTSPAAPQRADKKENQAVSNAAAIKTAHKQLGNEQTTQGTEIPSSSDESSSDNQYAGHRNRKERYNRHRPSGSKARTACVRSDDSDCSCDDCDDERRMIRRAVRKSLLKIGLEKVKAGRRSSSCHRHVHENTRKVSFDISSSGPSSDSNCSLSKNKLSEEIKNPLSQKERKVAPRLRETALEQLQGSESLAIKQATPSTGMKQASDNIRPEVSRPWPIAPPRLEITRVEHTIETSGDPRPNCFFDTGSSSARVYHGPFYGNNTIRLHPGVHAIPYQAPIGICLYPSHSYSQVYGTQDGFPMPFNGPCHFQERVLMPAEAHHRCHLRHSVGYTTGFGNSYTMVTTGDNLHGDRCYNSGPQTQEGPGRGHTDSRPPPNHRGHNDHHNTLTNSQDQRDVRRPSPDGRNSANNSRIHVPPGLQHDRHGAADRLDRAVSKSQNYPNNQSGRVAEATADTRPPGRYPNIDCVPDYWERQGIRNISSHRDLEYPPAYYPPSVIW